jgi:hypothetical protein
MLEALEYEYFNAPPEGLSGAGGRALREALDTCAALGMDVRALVPAGVYEWYGRADYFSSR